MIVALLNQKGGASKTTLALHLAGEWASSGKRFPLVSEINKHGPAAREITALCTEIERIAP